MQFYKFIILLPAVLFISAESSAGSLSWPVGCIPGIDCVPNNVFHVSYPDIDGDGRAFDCTPPGYTRHTGTDITVNAVEDGVPVFAADSGTVLWVSGGKFDHCPDRNEPDCKPELRPVIPGLVTTGECTDFGSACGVGNCCLSWGFNAGNFVLIKHDSGAEAAITFYAHLRKGSIMVANGQKVEKGEKIAEVGSSGASLTPHLHFSVWNKEGDHFELADPWAGKCGPNYTASLWQFSPPYRSDLKVTKEGTGAGIITAGNGELHCGSNCSATLPPGAVITLKATPYNGSEFLRWDGGCRGSSNSCTITAEGTIGVSAIFRDTAPPVIRSIDIPPFTSSLTVPVTSFAARDNIGITGYHLTESPTQPSDTSAWQSVPPTSYSCASPGKKSVYAWVRDSAGNVSSVTKATFICGAVNAAQTTPLAIPPTSLPLLSPAGYHPDGT